MKTSKGWTYPAWLVLWLLTGTLATLVGLSHGEMLLRGGGATMPRLLYQHLLTSFAYQRSYFVELDTEYVAYSSKYGKADT